MARANSASAVLRELPWLAPFVLLGLAALALARPEPFIPPAPIHGRVVTDGRGATVIVPLHAKAVFNGITAWYLEITHSPETLAYAGKPGGEASFAKGTMGRAYPSIVRNGALWRSPGGTMEATLAQDRGYTYFVYDPAPLRRWGLTVVSWGTHEEDKRIRAPGWTGMQIADWDKHVVRDTTIINAALGQQQLADRLVADYTSAYRSLVDDLRPDTLTSRPRLLNLLAFKDDWTGLRLLRREPADDWRMGVSDAAKGLQNAGREQEAERILAMDPDIILTNEGREDFARDPRWQGLKALRENRVYNGHTGPERDFAGSTGSLLGLTYNPLWQRWTAEIAHPERMPGGLRERVRTHVAALYNYHLNDAEIDELLNVAQNRGSAGYARFLAGAGR